MVTTYFKSPEELPEPKVEKFKCGNCGAKMISTYTRQGLNMMICPRVKMYGTKDLNGILVYTVLYCKLNVNGLKASFEKLKGQSSLTVNDLCVATKETVDIAKLCEQANLAIMLGLPADELADLFRCATQLGYATGISTTKAIEALCKDVGRRSRLILDNIGIAFKAQDAYKAYPNLSRTEAWQKYALRLIREKASELK